MKTSRILLALVLLIALTLGWFLNQKGRLHRAAKTGDVDRMRECLDRGDDINALFEKPRPWNGRPPRGMAMRCGC